MWSGDCFLLFFLIWKWAETNSNNNNKTANRQYYENFFFCYLKLTILYGSAHRFRPNMLTAGAVSAIVEAFILHVDHFFPGGESLCFCLFVLTPHSVVLQIFWPFVKPHMKSSHCLLFHHLLYKVWCLFVVVGVRVLSYFSCSLILVLVFYFSWIFPQISWAVVWNECVKFWAEFLHKQWNGVMESLLWDHSQSQADVVLKERWSVVSFICMGLWGKKREKKVVLKEGGFFLRERFLEGALFTNLIR